MVAQNRLQVMVGMIAVLSLTGMAQPPRIEIAPNVFMPQIIMNAHQNTSQWIRVARADGSTLVGMDNAWDYGTDAAKVIGEAMGSSGVPRAELFLTTKVPCCPKDLSRWPFLKFSGCDTSRDTVADFKQELDWLGLGYADLLLLHFKCDHFEDTLRTWRIMESFVLNGTARSIGVSNFNQADIDQLVEVAVIKPVVNQAGYAIGSPGNATLGRDAGTIKRCRELNITYEAYGVFGEPHATAPTSAVDVLHHPTVVKVAEKHGVSTAQVAARWVVQQGMVAVMSSGNPEHMQSDLQIFDFQLSDSEMVELNAVSKAGVIV